VGDFAIREPLVLGHEIAGVVERVGSEVAGITPGDRIVVDPSFPCGRCAQCRRGRRNLCTDVRFLGSAARMPHAQGGFRQRLVVDASQCVPLPAHVSFADAVFAEPLAVVMHAIGRAGPLLGREALITGAGPIGLLGLIAAVHAGAAAVTITDICEEPLRIARRVGATTAIDVSAGGEVPDSEVAIEASGAPAGLDTCVRSVRPGGRVVMLGMLPPGTVPLMANRAVTRELELAGSFRFSGDEFLTAVSMLSSGLDVAPLLTGRFPLADAVEAFGVAGDRRRSLKVQIQLSDDDPDARG
jgi:L-idonate 5-dehydrogenase